MIEENYKKYEYVDRARLMEAELESKKLDERRWEKEKYFAELAKWQKIRNVWLIAFGITLTLAVMLSSSAAGWFASSLLTVVLISGLAVWKIKPKYLGNDFYEGRPADRSPHYAGSARDNRGTNPGYSGYPPYPQELPWYCRTGWIIFLGMFTGGMYWFIGPIIRITWKKSTRR